MHFQQYIIPFCAALIGGGFNAVAGGGTLLTFPSLLAVGQLPKVASATSTVALWPGSLSSLWGYRKEVSGSGKAILLLGVPSLLGGGIGALMFSNTSSSLFLHLIPFLIFASTCLFMGQGSINRWIQARSARPHNENDLEMIGRGIPKHWYAAMFFQFFIALYGGYFGAGIGIVMLATLSFMGFTDIHRMNGMKNINALCINGTAIAVFIIRRVPAGEGVGPNHTSLINWPVALLLAVAALVGGYSGARIARKVGRENVRRMVIFVGLFVSIKMLLFPFHK